MFILGAGASKEAKFPTGDKLKVEIAKILDIRFETGSGQISGDKTLVESIKLQVPNKYRSNKSLDLHLDTCWRIRDAMPLTASIDNFVDIHRGNEEVELCSKLAIVRAILGAERESNLWLDGTRNDSRINFGLIEKTWFNKFFCCLSENCSAEQLPERLKTVKLIIFNYDRCVEHYLYQVLQTCYCVRPHQAVELLQNIEIFHPYGKVGHLPWEKNNASVAFGEDIMASRLLELAVQIKTFAEGTDPNSSDVSDIRNVLNEARIIIFLGFAFHPINLKFLTSTGVSIPKTKKFCLATAHDISSSDCEIIKDDLKKLIGEGLASPIIRNDLKCYELFQQYGRSLRFTKKLSSMAP